MDLRHLNRDVLKYAYDIESLYNIFTVAFINDKSLTLMLFGDEQFDKYDNEYFINKMKEYVSVPDNLTHLNIESSEEMEYNIVRAYVGDKDSINGLVWELYNIISSKPMSHDLHLTSDYELNDFAEYQGWNSYNYDTHMLVLALISLNATDPRPSDIRLLSDYLIRADVPPFLLYEYMEEKTLKSIKQDAYKKMYNTLIYTDGHIDWAKIIKDTGDDANDNLLTPGLKREMARFGLDIITDDTVTNSNHIDWSKEDIDTLVEYNFNDVLGTKVIGEMEYIQVQLAIRDNIRKKFPYTSARSMDTNLLNRYEPAPRDITAGGLVELYIGGPYRKKPQDTPTVQYTFPVPDPDRPGQTMNVDLWEYMEQHEENIHPHIKTFFNHFRGKDTRKAFDDMVVKSQQPVTKKGLMNVPYFDGDGNPLNCYVRLSTGGAHGGECATLSAMTPDEINHWIESDIGIKKSDKATIDKTNVVHIDWSSFYPTLASKMKLYMTSDGVDRYEDMRVARIQTKKELGKLIASGKRETPEFYSLDLDQDGQKFILNNATGKGNTHKPYAKLPLDNRTLAMRLMGNMLIWCLGQRLAAKGAYIISTNTDGLYIYGLSIEESQEIIDEYVAIYGMPVDPEHIERFINRDVSTRAEAHDTSTVPTIVSGDLGNAMDTIFSESVIGRNLTYPLVSGHAVVRYIFEDKEWLTKPYDRERMKSYILDEYNKEKFNPQAWYYIYAGTRSRRLLINGEIQDKIARLVLTRGGNNLTNETSSGLSKVHSINVFNQIFNSDVTTFGDIVDFSTGAPYDWSNVSRTDKIEDYEIDFVRNENSGRANKKANYVPVGFSSQSTYITDPKEHNYATLGFKHELSDTWEPLKRWNVTKMTHFTSTVGENLPFTHDLVTFNKDKLDIGAYLDWAENILDTWKITNNIPEVNLEKHDDTVLPLSRSTRKPTKKERGINLLWNMYGFDERPTELVS